MLFNSIGVTAANNYGDWASESINSMISNNIIICESDRDYYLPITRLEIAKIISAAYQATTKDTSPHNAQYFTDTTDPNVSVVSKLGVMNGYGDGTFLPDAFTSRQEMAKILLTYQAVVNNATVDLSDSYAADITDYETLSEWAKPYVSTAINTGLLKGYDDGSFGGLKPVSWQEAIVMILRVSDFNIDEQITELTQADFGLNVALDESTATISWNNLYDKMHTLAITEQRLSRYEGDIPPNSPIILNFNGETEYTLNFNFNKKYIIKISCDNFYSEIEVNTPRIVFEDKDAIKSAYPTNQEEAEIQVTEIVVPVWTLQNSVKIPTSMTLKVHTAIAEKVLLIFEEIFNGDEKFPIKDLGCYSWRGGTSEHNGGTAIDINSNENYCIYNNGTTIGSHWKPYDDPYSITPYGDVVSAFEKHGFTWGGDAWSNPKDYMHFSYLGT